jgi:hypothetical protein
VPSMFSRTALYPATIVGQSRTRRNIGKTHPRTSCGPRERAMNSIMLQVCETVHMVGRIVRAYLDTNEMAKIKEWSLQLSSLSRRFSPIEDTPRWSRNLTA